MNLSSTRPVVSEFIAPALAGVLVEGFQIMTTTTIKGAGALITNRETFSAGSLAGYWSPDAFGDDVYHVTSYGVSIARWRDGVGHIDHVAYEWSQTTSKHANIVKRAWNL